MDNATFDLSPQPETSGRPMWVNLRNTGIVVASLATMTTTGLGMFHIFHSFILAPVMTLLAQAVLISTSVALGRDIGRFAAGDVGEGARRRGITGNVVRYFFLLSMFSLVFFICWFFSFNFYFNQMFSLGENQLEAIHLPQQAADLALFPLHDRVTDAVAQDTARVLNDPAVTAYLNWINSVTKSADDPTVQARIAGEIARENEVKRAHQTETQATLDSLQPQLAALDAARKRLEATRANQKQQIQQDLTEIGALQAQLATLTHSRNDLANAAHQEEMVGLDGRPYGRGPVWQKDMAQIADLDKQIAQVKNTQLDPLTAQQTALMKSLADTEAELVDTDNKLAPLRQQITEAQALLPNATNVATAGAPLSRLRQDLIDARTVFNNNPSPTTFTALANACGPIVTRLRGASALSGGDCQSAQVDQALRSRPDLIHKFEDFQDKCRPEVINQRLQALTADLRQQMDAGGPGSFRPSVAALASPLEDTANNVINPCLGLGAALGVPTTDLQQTLQTFVQQHSLQQDQFSQTVTAAFDLLHGRGTNAARLGAYIALAQDIFVLLLSILDNIMRRDRVGRATPRRLSIGDVQWATQPDDPPDIAAAKAILHGADDRPQGAAVLPANFGADLPTDQRQYLTQTLRELIRSGVAKQRRSGEVVLSSDGMEAVERIVIEYTRDRSHRPLTVHKEPQEAASLEPTNSARPVNEHASSAADGGSSAQSPAKAPNAEEPLPSEGGITSTYRLRRNIRMAEPLTTTGQERRKQSVHGAEIPGRPRVLDRARVVADRARADERVHDIE